MNVERDGSPKQARDGRDAADAEPTGPLAPRQQRLAARLRENLMRRKDLMRSRGKGAQAGGGAGDGKD